MALILAVDDNATNLALIERLLAKLPEVETIALEDAVLALDWCAENRPDLILLDYMMPELDGLAFMRRLKTLPGRAATPVIMITADLERDVRYQALEIGARDFLTKPLDAAEFIARIKNQLALIDAERKLADRAAWLAEEVAKARRRSATARKRPSCACRAPPNIAIRKRGRICCACRIIHVRSRPALSSLARSRSSSWRQARCMTSARWAFRMPSCSNLDGSMRPNLRS